MPKERRKEELTMWEMWWLIPVFIGYTVVGFLVTRKCGMATTIEKLGAKFIMGLFWPITLISLGIMWLYYERIKKGKWE